MLIKTIKRACIGYLIGMAVGNIIAFLTAFSSSDGTSFVATQLIERTGSEALAFLLQTVLSGFIGAAGFGGMSFFEIEHWSMLRTVVTHLALIYAVYIPIAYILCWIVKLNDLLIIVAIMAVSYFIIWLVMCAIYRAQVRELNTLQSNLKGKGVTDP